MALHRKLIRVGDSDALTISKDMREHMGLDSNLVEVEYVPGGVLLRRPLDITRLADRTEKRYGRLIKKLAK